MRMDAASADSSAAGTRQPSCAHWKLRPGRKMGQPRRGRIGRGRGRIVRAAVREGPPATRRHRPCSGSTLPGATAVSAVAKQDSDSPTAAL